MKRQLSIAGMMLLTSGIMIACKPATTTDEAEAIVVAETNDAPETIVFDRTKRFSVDDRLEQIWKRASRRLGGELGAGKLPAKMRLIALKQERQLELHVKFTPDDAWQRVKTCRIVAASGRAGPKLQEGDFQVPEGEYGIESLNPNSNYYLALKVAYPSKEDTAMARRDGRDTRNLGSFIMIHGNGGSIGCIAVSNEAIEEIFWLAARVKIRNIELLSAPFDFRTREIVVPPNAPSWTEERYQRLKAKMLESP